MTYLQAVQMAESKPNVNNRQILEALEATHKEMEKIRLINTQAIREIKKINNQLQEIGTQTITDPHNFEGDDDGIAALGEDSDYPSDLGDKE